MIRWRALLWIEVVFCFAYAAVLTIFGLAMTAHWIVVIVTWGAEVPARSLLLTLYAASTALGIGSVFILLNTQLGATAQRSSLRLIRLGLGAGAAAAVLIPGGDPLSNWYQDDRVVALFAIVLPCLCFLHFAYLARRALFQAAR